MRDKPSDNLSKWLGVRVEGGRATKLEWDRYRLGKRGKFLRRIGEPLN